MARAGARLILVCGKRSRFWGGRYELQLDELVAELNGAHEPTRVAALQLAARAARR